MSGRVYGIGVGPGDPELMTLKAARLLSEASVVAYPQARDGESLSRAIAGNYVSEAAIELPLTLPMGDRAGTLQAYDAAVTMIALHLEDGRDVAVLCEGDPFLYGSFMYLFARLAEEYEVLVVPGVTSITAAAAACGQPMVAGSEMLAILPATMPDERLQAGLLVADVAAIIKVGRHYPRVRALLDRLALVDRAVYVERATMAEQRILPLASVGPSDAVYFSLIIVRRVGEPPDESPGERAEEGR